MNKKIWIYGTHACLEALKNSNRTIYEVRCSNNDIKIAVQKIRQDLHVSVVSQENLSNAVKNSNHQGIAVYCDMLIVHPKLNELIDDHQYVLILDEMQDVHNIGAIMRSMAFMGFTALIVTKKNTPDIEKHAIKTSSGAIEKITIFQIANIPEGIRFLKAHGFYTIALDHRGNDINQIFQKIDKTDKIAGVIGSEGFGIGRLAMERCDAVVSLNAKSDFCVLNASVAAGIFMYIMRSD